MADQRGYDRNARTFRINGPSRTRSRNNKDGGAGYVLTPPIRRRFRKIRTADTNARAKADGQPRIIPTDKLDIPPLVSWPVYRGQLVAQRVRPQPTPTTPPTYCGAASLVISDGAN
jgi:hypothetical protein